MQAASNTDDLTGTLVRVTDGLYGPCTPLAVFSRAIFSDVPQGCTACDHLFVQSVPSDRWGLRYLAAPIAGTTAYTLRVLAAQDGTLVTRNGGPPQMLNAGAVLEVNNVSGPTCIEATAPVSVAQLLEGGACGGMGDPSMVVMSPDDQGMSDRLH